MPSLPHISCRRSGDAEFLPLRKEKEREREGGRGSERYVLLWMLSSRWFQRSVLSLWVHTLGTYQPGPHMGMVTQAPQQLNRVGDEHRMTKISGSRLD